MLLLLRRFKRQLFMDNEFRKYLSYATGELLLVVVGILIALQIDNWNEDRQQRARLQTYLETIAGNMREDLDEIRLLREDRLRQLESAVAHQYLSDRPQYSVTEVFAATAILMRAQQELFFSANTSGYDALKSSPVLGRLQGTGMEGILSSYYETVRRIELLEQNHAEFIRGSRLELMRQRQLHMEASAAEFGDVEIFAMSNPSALSEERFAQLQPMYRRAIQSPILASIVFTQGRVETMILLYDTLMVLAEVFEDALSVYPQAKPGDLPRTAIDRWRAGEGEPAIIENGRVRLQNFWLGVASSRGSSAFNLDSFSRDGDTLRIGHLGGAEWASVYVGVEGVDASERGRYGVDFSRFNTLELEMKGDRGGEVVLVAVKDSEYPDDIPPVSVELTLDNSWRRYEIDLSDFAPNNLGELNVPLAFNFTPAQEPVSIAVRSVRYR